MDKSDLLPAETVFKVKGPLGVTVNTGVSAVPSGSLYVMVNKVWPPASDSSTLSVDGVTRP